MVCLCSLTYTVFLPLFKLCGETTARQAAAFSFGTAYQQSVSVSSHIALSHRNGRNVFIVVCTYVVFLCCVCAV